VDNLRCWVYAIIKLMKKAFKNPLFYLSVVLVIAVAFTVFNLVKADSFREPTQSFPQSNVNAPIDESGAYQTKEGNLALGGLCLSKSSWDSSLECKSSWEAATGISSRYFKTSHRVVINDEAYSYAWCEPDEVRTGGGCSVGSGHLVENRPIYSSGAQKGGWVCHIDKPWSVSAWVVCIK
jgi:hypothetical protein